jgi:hypothetical protein
VVLIGIRIRASSSDAIVNSGNDGLISISPIKCSSDSGALRYSIG